jgi:Serpin (serine protease inhibitor)
MRDSMMCRGCSERQRAKQTNGQAARIEVVMSSRRFGRCGRTVAAAVTAAAMSLSGCGSKQEQVPRDARVITEATGDLSSVVQGNNAFAWSLYRAAALHPGNLFFSPFSISAAFGMTWAGAAGETAAEMRRVLAIGTAEDAPYHTGLGALIRDLGGEHAGRGYQLYIQPSLPLLHSRSADGIDLVHR